MGDDTTYANFSYFCHKNIDLCARPMVACYRKATGRRVSGNGDTRTLKFMITFEGGEIKS